MVSHMKRSHIAGIAVVVALVGAVVFWKTRGGDDDNKTDQVADNKDDTPQDVKRVQATDDQPGRRGQGEVSVLVDDDPEGDLLLQGQVVDDQLNPVGGATVIISSVPPKSTITEEDGSFEFAKLVGRPYELIARAPEGVAGPVTARLTETNEPVILRLRPASRVAVTVLDAAKREPISGATVELRDLDTQTEITGADGVATIGNVVPGGYAVAAYAPGFSTTHTWLRVAAGNTVSAETLMLRRGAPVVGTVVDPDGAPVKGAAVLYSGASDWAQQADPRRDAVKTDDKGAFRFEALPEGTFRFVARHESYAPGRSELITLDGSTERSGVVVEMEPGATVKGLVVSTDNAPMGGSRVRVGVKVAGMRWGRPRQVYANDKGEFLIDGLPRKPLQLVALHDDGASSLVDVDMTNSEEEEVTLTLDLADSIEGIVLDTEGEPVEGAQVSAFPDFRKGATIERGEWRLRGFPDELTGSDGTFKLSGIKEGDYTVRASPPGAANTRGSRWLREGVEAKAGDKDVKIVLEADGGVEGVVQFADGEPPAMFSVNFGWGASTPFSTKDGSFEVNDLPPQKYSVTIRGAGFDTKTIADVEIKGGDITDLGTITIKKGRALRGRVVSKAGDIVEGATVSAGRMMFGTGSSTATAGGGGPPMARNTKSVTTDENGEFSISGVTKAEQLIVAEHETIGRSKAMVVNRSQESTEDIELVLEPFGALEGIATLDGKPAEEVRISATSTQAGGAIFGVATGPDGKFRFDKLAPDTYKVSAVMGMVMRGMSFYSSYVEVKSDETATVDITIDNGNITLEVAPMPTNDETLSAAIVNIFLGEVNAANGSELNRVSAGTGDMGSFSFVGMGRLTTSFEKLLPGNYSVCVQPMPNGLGMSEMMQYMGNHSDVMAVYCKPVVVAEAPELQKLEVPVEVPELIPPEDEGDDS